MAGFVNSSMTKLMLVCGLLLSAGLAQATPPAADSAFLDWSDGRITRSVPRDSSQQVLWLRAVPSSIKVTYTLRNASGTVLQTKTVNNAYSNYPHYSAGDGGKLLVLPRLAFSLSSNTYYTHRADVELTLDGETSADVHMDYLQRRNGSNRFLDMTTYLNGVAPPIALKDVNGRALSAHAGATRPLTRGESGVTGSDEVIP